MSKRRAFIRYGLVLSIIGQLNVGSLVISYGSIVPTRFVVRDDIRHKQNGNQKPKTPEEIWASIKSFAKSSAYSNSTFIVRPQFNVKYVGNTAQLELVKGRVGDLGFGEDPYRMPFEKQILIEVLRRALSETPWLELKRNKPGASSAKGNKSATSAKVSQPDNFWDTYLKQAEVQVRQSIKDIESISDSLALKAKLDNTEQEIDRLLYIKLYEAIEQHAKTYNYNLIYGRGGESVKKFSVSVSSMPDGARIFVMTNIVHQKQLMMNVDSSKWPWLELVQNPASLLGKYRYLAVWPDGSRTEGDIEVNSANPLAFKH